MSRLLLPLLCAVGGGMVFDKAGGDVRQIQVLTLMMLGLWGACILYTLGLLPRVTFFALGFSIIINPRKFFGMPPAFFRSVTYGEAAFQFVSFTDLAIFIIFLLAIFGQLSEKKEKFRLVVPKWTLIGIAGYAAVALASCFYAPNLERAAGQLAFDAKLLALMVVLGHVFSDRKLVYAYLPLFVYGMGLACVFEFMIVVLEQLRILRFTTSYLFMGIPLGMGVQEKMLGVATMYRISGTFGHANYLGAAMAAVALVIWEMLLANRSILQYRTIVWGVWAAICIVFLMTLSRGAWLSMAVAGASYFPFALKVQGRAWLHSFLKRYAVSSIFGAAVLIIIMWAPLERRIFHSNPSAMDSRGDLNTVTFDRIEKRPFFGGGIGNHIVMTNGHPIIGEMVRTTNSPMPVHNTYLLVTTEVGIVGAFFYFLIPLSLFITAIRRCFKCHNDPLAASCLAFASAFIIFWMTDGFSPVTRQINCAYLYWAFMGVVVGMQYVLDPNHAPAEKPPAPTRRRFGA